MRGRLLDVVQRGDDVPAGYYEPVSAVEAVRPFHWHLEFPEVFLNGRSGFDGFVGNPPFQSGKGGENSITAVFGDKYMSSLELLLVSNKRSADLSAYFLWQARKFLRLRGSYGFVVTNTVSEGSTREVALEPLYESGGGIYRARPNLPWPGAAAVIISTIHVHNGNWRGGYLLDDTEVDYISSRLEPFKDIGDAYILSQHLFGFHGTKPRGKGFTLKQSEFDDSDSIHLPNYLSGQDINSHPGFEPNLVGVYCIFHMTLLEKRTAHLQDFFDVLKDRVYAYRQSTGIGALMKYWWRYEHEAQELYDFIRDREISNVFAICRVSNKVMIAQVEANQIFSDGTVVFPYISFYVFTVLQSTLYSSWVRKYCATFKEDIRFNIKDVLVNYVPPCTSNMPPLEAIGETYHETRRQIMQDRWEGLTATYNRFHNREESAADIQGLRDLHVEMDRQVAAAYGWDDLALEHGYHDTAQGLRFTISEAARREVLTRLLKLNHERFAEECRQGLHTTKKGKKACAEFFANQPHMRDAGSQTTTASATIGAVSLRNKIRPFNDPDQELLL